MLEGLPSASVTIYADSAGSVAPVREVLACIFRSNQVTVVERTAQSADVVVERDRKVVATSTVTALIQSLLLVNSDVYMTGSRRLVEAELPETLRALHDIPFRLRGYPDSDSEKLLLVAVSRVIERRAFEADDGVLRVGFQWLSRFADEPGTFRVYEQLADTDVTVHVYGVGDADPPVELDLPVHTGHTDFHRHVWFVVFQSPSSADAAGLYAVDRGDNEWEGFWTDTADRVAAIANRIVEGTVTYPPSYIWPRRRWVYYPLA